MLWKDKYYINLLFFLIKLIIYATRYSNAKAYIGRILRALGPDEPSAKVIVPATLSF